MFALLKRLFRWLFGAATPNADGSVLAEIGGTGENMDAITLKVGQIRSFKIKPNKNDVTIEDVTRNIGGSVTGDAFVGLSDFVSAPGDPAKFTLTGLEPTSSPSALNYSFDSDTDGGVQTVTKTVQVTVLPENADDADLEELL